MRNYLYVSTRKVDRLSRTLKPPRGERIRGVALTVGPAGGNVVLDAPASAEVLRRVARIEQLLDAENGLRYWTDPGLMTGHWFRAEAIEMAYGPVPDEDGTAAFVGLEGRSLLCLTGTRDYLLDRAPRSPEDVVKGPPATGSAAVSAVRATSQVVSAEEVEEDRRYENAAVGLYSVLNRAGGVEPFDLVARAARVFEGPLSGSRVVIGSPLYVAFHVPD